MRFFVKNRFSDRFVMRICTFVAPSPHLLPKKHRFLIQFSRCAFFTDRSARNNFCFFVKRHFSGGFLMRICEFFAPLLHLSLRSYLDFLFKSASTLTHRVKGTLTPALSLTQIEGRTLSIPLQVGIYSHPQSEGHPHSGSFFHTHCEGKHSLSHTCTLILLHTIECSLTP